MSRKPFADPGEVSRARNRIMRCLSFALAAVTLTAAPVLSGALEEHVLFEGLAVGEGWTTDDDSVLLSTNEGDPAGAADLQFWQAIEFHPSFHLFAMEELSAESGSGEGTQSELTLMLLRYSRRGDHPFSIDAGKITTPIGSFPDRHLADVNPLIGRPANYDLEYPLGVAFNGRVSRFDYMASVVSLPLRDGRAMPEADDAPRPALAFGVTPFTGFRMGAFGTRGPFLGVESEEMMAAGSSWREFDQQVIGLDFSFTRGYFVLNGEISTASYEVPSHASKIHGKSWFLEGRQTITPRLFVALRLEQSEYPFILPISPAYWVARPVNLYDAEAGLGFRISPTTLLKGSYRRDLWPVDESIRQYYPEGYAVALQLSQRFDVVSWFSRRP